MGEARSTELVSTDELAAQILWKIRNEFHKKSTSGVTYRLGDTGWFTLTEVEAELIEAWRGE